MLMKNLIAGSETVQASTRSMDAGTSPAWRSDGCGIYPGNPIGSNDFNAESRPIPIKAKKAGLKYKNNHIERYNGKIKDRTKTMRGDFYSFKGGESFIKLNHIIHNFVNPHQELKGKTPAEAAEIFIPLKRNKLLSLIKWVRLNHITKR